jgi:hypothetical protein
VGWELAFGVLAIAAVWPLFYVRYPAIQDWPQHLAAVRVLHDFADPRLGFARFFELRLQDTQYLSYYLAAHGLAYLFGVELANRLLVAAAMVAIPYAVRSLLHALGKDGRMGLLALPLTYNAHLILGFFNFTAAIALSLYAIALGLRLRRDYSIGRAGVLAALVVVIFYTHVVPFGLTAIALVLVGLGSSLRESVRGLAPLVPGGLAALSWLWISPAGRATATAASAIGVEERGPRPVFTSPAAAWEQTPRWLTDVFAGDLDLRLLQAWAALLLVVWVIALWERICGRAPPAPGALARRLALRLWLLPPLCGLLYFVMPTSYDWIWPIAQRFPLLCALWLVVTLPSFRFGKEVLLSVALALGAASFHRAGKAFAEFDRQEVGDFDQALAVLPEGQRVVGLIFDRYSRHVAFAPFMHYVAYYQARKGGAVMFSFADFPQSPFHFREDNRPPRVPPRWEWLPERVRPKDLMFYDYALVRGGPGAIARARSGFAAIYLGASWSVWKRSAPAASH